MAQIVKRPFRLVLEFVPMNPMCVVEGECVMIRIHVHVWVVVIMEIIVKCINVMECHTMYQQCVHPMASALMQIIAIVPMDTMAQIAKRPFPPVLELAPTKVKYAVEMVFVTTPMCANAKRVTWVPCAR